MFRVSLMLLALLLASCSPVAQQQVAQQIADTENQLSPRNDLWRIHFIDIGQGLAVLHEFPCGAVLIDTGGEQDSSCDSDRALTQYLDAFFARRKDLQNTLSLLVLTHPHIDHTRGVPKVLERYKVLHAIDDGMDQGSGGAPQGELHSWAAGKPAGTYYAVELKNIPDANGLTNDVIDPLRCQDIDPKIRALWGHVDQDPGWPGLSYGKTPFQNANNHSVVLRIDFGKASGLFTGDLEEPAIKDLLRRSAGNPILDVDVYQVGHHGSINGTTPEFVQAMSPQIAVFSASSASRHEEWSGWQHGHPRKEIVAMLQAGIERRRRPIDVLVGVHKQTFVPGHIDKAVYSTGWDGAVVIEAQADGRMRVVTSGRKSEK